MDTTISELKSQTVAAQTNAKNLRSILSSLNSTLSTSDLISSVSALESEKSEILVRLETLKAGKAQKVTKEERQNVEVERKKWAGVCKRRKKIANEMWKLIEDNVSEIEIREELREAFGMDE
jgi:26S proteasome regulatory subunit, ATPase 3, interacting protein